jgi:hypothetical protein
MNGGRSFNTHRIVCIYSFAVNPVRNSSGALNPALRGGTRNYSKTPLQPPAQESLWLGESRGALFLTG